MGVNEIARWLDKHSPIAASATTAGFSGYGYAVLASILAIAAIIVVVRLRNIRIWPGVFFAMLAIEALVATIFEPPGPIEKAAILALGALLCVGEIWLIQDSGKRMEQDTEQKQTEIRASFVALKDALTAQFQQEMLGIRASLENQLLGIKTATEQTGKALISHQLWTLVANLSSLTQGYFKKIADFQSVPFGSLVGSAWFKERGRRWAEVTAEHARVLHEYNQGYYNQVVTIRNELNEQYGIQNQQLNEALKPSQSDVMAIAMIATLLTLMSDELRTK